MVDERVRTITGNTFFNVTSLTHMGRLVLENATFKHVFRKIG